MTYTGKRIRFNESEISIDDPPNARKRQQNGTRDGLKSSLCCATFGMAPQLTPGETLLIESPANLFRGLEGVGGKMHVTNRRIIFQPYALNIQSHPEFIPLEEITGAKPQNTWGFIRNRLVIRVRSGQEFHFITWKREKIIAALQSQLPGLTLQ